MCTIFANHIRNPRAKAELVVKIMPFFVKIIILPILTGKN